MESANRRDRSAAPRLASSISILGTVALSCHPPALVNSEFDKRECLLEVLVIGGLSDLPWRIRTRGPGPINQRGPGGVERRFGPVRAFPLGTRIAATQVVEHTTVVEQHEPPIEAICLASWMVEDLATPTCDDVEDLLPE